MIWFNFVHATKLKKVLISEKARSEFYDPTQKSRFVYWIGIKVKPSYYVMTSIIKLVGSKYRWKC